jgi:hypothetical protein
MFILGFIKGYCLFCLLCDLILMLYAFYFIYHTSTYAWINKFVRYFFVKTLYATKSYNDRTDRIATFKNKERVVCNVLKLSALTPHLVLVSPSAIVSFLFWMQMSLRLQYSACMSNVIYSVHDMEEFSVHSSKSSDTNSLFHCFQRNS